MQPWYLSILQNATIVNKSVLQIQGVPKKWDLLLLLQVVNPNFFGTPCSHGYIFFTIIVKDVKLNIQNLPYYAIALNIESLRFSQTSNHSYLETLLNFFQDE